MRYPSRRHLGISIVDGPERLPRLDLVRGGGVLLYVIKDHKPMSPTLGMPPQCDPS